MEVQFPSVRKLAREMGSIPLELRRELRPRLRVAGEKVRQDVQQGASFSGRIPGAVRMTVAFGSKTGGVRIFVDAKKAPHARVLENLGRSGSFRHPVFGDRDNWVAQPARPFFFAAIKRNQGQVREQVADAVRASWPKGV